MSDEQTFVRAALHFLVELWWAVVLGFTAILGFLGRRTMNKVNKMSDEYVTREELEKSQIKLEQDILICQRGIKEDLEKNSEQIDKVHERIDELFVVLMDKR